MNLEEKLKEFAVTLETENSIGHLRMIGVQSVLMLRLAIKQRDEVIELLKTHPLIEDVTDNGDAELLKVCE